LSGWTRSFATIADPGRREQPLALALAELPEAVLPDDEAVVTDRPEVASTDLYPVPVEVGTGEGPLGDTAVAAGEVVSLAVVDVGDPLEMSRESSADLRLPDELRPRGSGPRGEANTQSSAKCSMIASTSCALNASRTR